MTAIGGRMRRQQTLGALALVAAGLAGIAWFWLELSPPRLGFDDTDSPEVSLRFLHAHPEIYGQAGVALLVLAVSLLIASFAVGDALAERSGPVAVRSLTAFGLVAAACFFLHGVLRFSAEPVLYIDDLDHDWGQAAYLVLQMAGMHGFAQAGIFALCAWVVAAGVVGWRASVVPTWLALLAAVPAFRIAGLVAGPFTTLPDATWIVAIAAIPGVMAWCLLLGVFLLRRSLAEAAPRAAAAASAASVQ
jgi:hypothetical protein